MDAWISCLEYLHDLLENFVYLVDEKCDMKCLKLNTTYSGFKLVFLHKINHLPDEICFSTKSWIARLLKKQKIKLFTYKHWITCSDIQKRVKYCIVMHPYVMLADLDNCPSTRMLPKVGLFIVCNPKFMNRFRLRQYLSLVLLLCIWISLPSSNKDPKLNDFETLWCSTEHIF